MKIDLISYEIGSFSFIGSCPEQICFLKSDIYRLGVMWFRTSF